MKNKYARFLFLTLIILVIIFAFIFYLYDNAESYGNLLELSVPGLSAIFLISLAFPAISSVSNVHLFRSMGADISYWDGFFLVAASTLANQLPVSGGVISKGFYLKRRHDISYAKFFSATTALFFCFVAVNGLVGIFVLLYQAFSKNLPVSLPLLVGFSAMVACFFVFWLPLERLRFPEKIRAWIRQSVEGWLLVSKNPVLLLKLIGLQIVLMLLLAVRYWLAFRMLSQNITFEWALLFSAASILTQLVSIAPGGLGVREAIVGAVASALGFDMTISIVAVGLDRLVSTLGIFILGGVSTAVLSRQISNLSLEADDDVII